MRTPLFLAGTAVLIAIGLVGCTPPTPTPEPPTPTPVPVPTATPVPDPCVALQAIADGSGTVPLASAAADLAAYLRSAGRPCAPSYTEYADRIAAAAPPLTPEEERYTAGQLAWACREDTVEGGCTEETYANPPVDPGGHVLDLFSAGPQLKNVPETTAALYELPGWTPVADRELQGGMECYTANNPLRGDWADVAVVTQAIAGTGIPVKPLPPAVPVNPPNPYRVLAPDGLYGWQVDPAAGKCYFVTLSRPGDTHYSPPVGVKQDAPVDDLQHCWERPDFYSILTDPAHPCP